RDSYERLAEVLVLFPKTEQELSALSGHQMVALITSWWPRWVEFFALCWFIQAQGDDVLFPFIDETVTYNLSKLGPPPAGKTWPGPADFIAPTTPVLTVNTWPTSRSCAKRCSRLGSARKKKPSPL